jgi:hypothetical protein
MWRTNLGICGSGDVEMKISIPDMAIPNNSSHIIT